MTRRRTWTFDPRPGRGGRLVWPSPRKELRRIVRERYGDTVRLAGECGSYFFLNAAGEHIDGTPIGCIRKMLRGDVETILSDLARAIPPKVTP